MTESTSYTPQEVRETRRVIPSANNARQTDAALPTTVDMSSPQTYEAGVPCQPSESASRALSNGHSTTIESMGTNIDGLRHRVTTCPAPSPLPAVSTSADEQASRRIESLEWYQRNMLERASHTPQEIRHISLSADNARQTDATLPTIADISSTQTDEAGVPCQPAESASWTLSNGYSTTIESMGTNIDGLRHRVTTRPAPSPLPAVSTSADEQASRRIENSELYQRGDLERTSHIPRGIWEIRHIVLSVDNARRMDMALMTADVSNPQPWEAGATRQPTLPTLAPLPLPQTQGLAPANGHRRGTQKEEDLTQLEQEIISSPWLAANTLEPPCGSPECPHTADCYGVRGRSCYTAFVTNDQLADTFVCWRCDAYSARNLEDAIRHQRSDHFNHAPFLCVPENGTAW